MSSVETYLDRVCRGLRVNPAEAEDIREELRSHLTSAIEECAARSTGQRDAVDLAIASFGDPGTIHERLDRVHQGDAWWLRRLRGMGLGMLVGGLLSLALSAGGALGLITHLLPFADTAEMARAPVVMNGAAVGGVIGLLAAGGRGVLAGWSAGAVLWLVESVVYWLARAGGGSESASSMLEMVLLAPLFGGVFGAAVGAASAAVLSAASHIRPRIE